MEQRTVRLYWPDAYCFTADATVLAISGDALALDQSCFYPGGGGQPPDQGWIQLPDGASVPVTAVTADAAGLFWHTLAMPPTPTLVGATVKLQVEAPRRLALMRHHTALHVLKGLDKTFAKSESMGQNRIVNYFVPKNGTKSILVPRMGY